MELKKLYLGFFFILSLFTSTHAWAQVDFINQDLSQAIEQAKQDRKYIIVDVYADWCGWCKKMDATTFKDQKVSEFINNNMVALKINSGVGEGIDFAKKYGVKGLPTMVYLDFKGNLVRTVPGFKNASQLLKEIFPYKLENGSTGTQKVLQDYFAERLAFESKMNNSFSKDSTVWQAYRFGEQKKVYLFDEIKYQTNRTSGVAAASQLQLFYYLGDQQFKQALELLTKNDELTFTPSETHFMVYHLTKNGMNHLKLLQMINSISIKTKDLELLSTKAAVQWSINDRTDAKETIKTIKKLAKKQKTNVPKEIILLESAT